MPIRIACSNCQTPYALPEKMSGKKVRCMKCQQIMVVPEAEEVVEELELEVVEPEPPTRGGKSKAASAARPKEAEIDEDDPPAKPPSGKLVPAARGEDEEAADEVEEEARPRRKPKRKRRSKSDTFGTNLYRVALYQKAVLLCVLASITTNVLLYVLPPASLGLLIWFAIPVSILSSVCVFLLTTELFGIGVAVALAVLGLVPLVVPIPLIGLLGLVVLLVVNGAATRVLKQNDLKVGLLGASISEARRMNGDEGLGLSPAMMGGIAALILAGVASTWFSFSGGVRDLLGTASFPEVTTPFPIQNPVTLHISGVKDQATNDAIYAKVKDMGDPSPRGTASAATRKDNLMTVQVGPVADPKAFADKIDFGTVRGISGRIIRVNAR